MAFLTKRQTILLQTIKSNGGICNGKDLANITNVSLRTIQTEMAFLKKSGFIFSSQNGYSLVNSFIEPEIVTLQSDINDNTMILKRLLSNDNTYDMFDLAEELFLSESTLRSRLKEISKQIELDNLKIKIKNNSVSIIGTELDKRKMFRKMIFNDLPIDTADIDRFSAYFEDLDVHKVSEIILSSISEVGYYIQSPYSSGLLLGIMISLYRIYNGIHTPDVISTDNGSNEYKLSKRICQRFYDHYSRLATEEDISYIASLFQGQIYRNNKSNSNIHIDLEFEDKVRNIFNSVFEDYLISTDLTPYIHNIAMHLYEMIKRCHTGNYVVNHMHEYLRESCPFIYDVAVSLTKRLENVFHIQIPDDEIGFISVHIGLIIEKESCVSDGIRILLFSNNYHNIADNIKAKIIEHNGDKVSVYIMEPSNKAPKTDIDLIVATTKIGVIGKNVIEISPFYNIVDQAKLDTAISTILKDRELARNRRHLMELFSPELFFVREDIDSYDKAIQFLSDRMYDFGAVGKDFYQNVMERELLSPTCFFDSFAIPHSIHMNANETMVAVLINKNGIKWHHSKILLCIMISIKKENRDQFYETYNGIIQILCDNDKFRKLIDSKSLFEFLEQLA